MTSQGEDWLTRDQINEVLESLSADDLIESMGGNSAKMPTMAFNRAAERMGIEQATQKIRAADYMYLVQAIGGAVNVESPLSANTGVLLTSASSGE